MWPNGESGLGEKKNFVHIAQYICVGIFAFSVTEAFPPFRNAFPNH